MWIYRFVYTLDNTACKFLYYYKQWIYELNKQKQKQKIAVKLFPETSLPD